ncbi:MAG: ribosome silencing factor [Peptoniphilaceae bacterium]|nr:ribosome silencing factor [Bacillota bacterium]
MTEKTNLILKTLHDKLGVDITTIEFTDSTVADTFIIATGNVPSHTQAMADAVEQALAAEGERVVGTEGYREGNWILLDYGDVIVHLFLASDRAYYDLETLWQDQKITTHKEETV